ncbi:hypothetical protein ACFPDQ_02560 [Pseudofrancisella aestuarii]|uniref:DUF3160 domain-containing protein n=1 Tax=Pseudofrancisella aestuarii TaxID=2670347 RepID=A0ABV9TA45_9GAMM|nr:hypothetical protein [Pseudofrancisella aestuarii]
MERKIYVSIVIVVIAIIGMVYYTSYQNQQLDKQAVRAVYPVDKQAIYNGLLLANTKGDPSRYNTYLYFPNENQLLDNIPQCVEPTKAQAEEFLRAYSKVYTYILNQNLIKSNNPQEIGEYTKQVLDFIYNYQSFEYFRDLYAVQVVRDFFNAGKSINGTTEAEYQTYYLDNNVDTPIEITGVTPEQIANTVFTQSEQKELAKAESQLLTQVSENCVQAGYSTDFYSIWWAGLPSQGLLGVTSQVDMMYDIFFKSYYMLIGYQKLNKLPANTNVWQVMSKHINFVKEVMQQTLDDMETNQLILNTLTAEMLQDDFKNQNYSLPLRVTLFMKFINQTKYKHNYVDIYKKLSDKFVNEDYFIFQSFISWGQNGKLTESNFTMRCNSIRKMIMKNYYFDKYEYSGLVYSFVLSSCDKKQYKQEYLKQKKLYESLM